MVNPTLREIFENMSYGSVKENFDLTKAWIAKNGLKVPKTVEEIENAIQKSENELKSWMNVSAVERANLLNKFADEIEKHTTLICQTELYVRQILTKDTKSKSITLLADYLRYYAGWAFIIDKHLNDYKPYGLCAVHLSEFTPLFLIGAILAPALAAGNCILLRVSSNLIPITSLLSELSENIGIPKGIISVINTSNFEIFLNHKSIHKYTIISSIFDKITDFGVIVEKDLTTLHLQKSSAIVFDSADLDSACDSIVESSFSYRETFPSGIDNLYVQESVFDDFVERFKAKILKLNVGYPNNSDEKNLDIIVNEILPSKNSFFEIINKIPLQIGYKTFGNSLLLNKENNVLSITAFRTANEAIALANNTNLALATSVWSENISLVKEVTYKLKSNIVWVNIHGYLDINIPFSPTKDSGCGYFGGKEGLLEYMTVKNFKIKSFSPSVESAHNKRFLYYGGSFKKPESGLTEGYYKQDIRNCVEIAKKSYETWNNISPKVRSKYLLKLADVSKSMKIRNASLLEKWVEYLRDYAVLNNCQSSIIQQQNLEIKIVKESLGIIAIEVYTDENYTCLKLIISALISGNSLILLNSTDDLDEFLLELCKIFSSSGILSGVFNVIFNPNKDFIDTLLTHREIQTYFINYYDLINKKSKQTQHIKSAKNVKSSFDILKSITSNKCIYTNSGESFL